MTMQQTAFQFEEMVQFSHLNEEQPYGLNMPQECDFIPPPALELLYLILRGWGLQEKIIPTRGQRRYPEPSSWIPAFMEIISRNAWLKTFKNYALIAAMNDHESQSYQACISRAFDWQNIDQHLRDELVNLTQKKMQHF